MCQLAEDGGGVMVLIHKVLQYFVFDPSFDDPPHKETARLHRIGLGKFLQNVLIPLCGPDLILVPKV